MKRKHDLLDLFNGVEDRFVMEAIRSREGSRPVVRKSRVMLIAAAIAVALVLVGCTAAYFWLQDLSIGSGTYTQYYDEKGQALEKPEEVDYQILTFAGYTDSNANKAFAEWFAFLENYDPEGKYLSNEPDLPNIPNNYECVYGCYTQEMVEKLNEIVSKYNVKLLDEWVPVQRHQSDVALQEGLGVTTLLKPDAHASMEEVSGMLFPPFNFDLSFNFRLTGPDAAWTKTVLVEESYYHKEYLPVDWAWFVAIDKFEQWKYTTEDGVSLLLALNKTGDGFIVCDRGDAFQVICISANTTRSIYPEPDQVPGKKALEQMAETFDFGIDFSAVDAQAMKPAMDAAEAKYQEEHAYVPEVYGGFEEYMLENAPWFKRKKVYTFYDLNKDGEKELILGDLQGEIVSLGWVFSMQDGQLVDRGGYGGFCQENVTVRYNRLEHSAEESWQYWKWDFTFAEDDGEYIGTVYHNADGTWQLATESIWPEEAPTVTQAEAEAFMEKYKPVEMDWQPISNYPLSDGTTLGDYLDSLDDKPLSQEELRQLYVDTFADKDDEFRTHYRLMDVNGDGMEEILISGDGETVWEIFSCKYGQVRNMGMNDVTLCENGVFEQVCIFRREPGVEIEEHEFLAFDGWNIVSLDYVCYNKATASWQTDLDGTTITETEAQAILAKYTHIDQGMKPINELEDE